MDTLKELLALFGFGPENIQAVLYISLGSIFGTQVLKRLCPSLRAELLSVILGGICGSAFLPDPLKGALAGFILGSFWTAMYKPLMRLAYKRWPDLEDKVSAKPKVKVDKDGNIGVKVGDDLTTWTRPDGAPMDAAPDDTEPK